MPPSNSIPPAFPLREVKLPAGVSGRLLLSALPGRAQPWEEPEQAFGLAEAAILASGVSLVVNLVPEESLGHLSPIYLERTRKGALRWKSLHLPIPDYGVPERVDDLVAGARGAAGRLQRGEALLVHCVAGIGRTGLFAIAALLHLGVPLSRARDLVRQAGSGTESPAQRTLLQELAGRLGAQPPTRRRGPARPS